MNKSTKTVFILMPPALGHIYPILGLADQLVKQNINVIFYGNIEQQQLIEKTGANFRLYAHRTLETLEKREIHKENRNMMFYLMNGMINFSYELLPSLIRDVKQDQPNLIIYDQMFLPGKYLVKIVKNMSRAPKCVMFLPSFAMNNEIAMSVPGLVKKDLWSLALIIVLFIRQIMFSLYFGISVYNPLKMFTDVSDYLNIVAVFPELQPKREMFDHRFKFVGSCIAEEVRGSQVELKLKEILDDCSNPHVKLVYVSLGTVFNNNILVYQKIIEAFRLLNEKNNSSNLRMIVSLGQQTLAQLESKIQNGSYSVPKNVFLFSEVSQIEVLKRTALFITHGGQNSTSETIQYSVPVICIPIIGDQHLTSRRLCDELNCGIRFDAVLFKPNDLGDAVEEILSNPSYKDNITHLAKTSSKYNGVADSTKLILDSLATSF